MSRNKRQKTDSSMETDDVADDNAIDPAPAASTASAAVGSMLHFTPDDLKKINKTVNAHRATLLAVLSSDRESERKIKLCRAINEMSDCFTRIMCAYSAKCAYVEAARNLGSVLTVACKDVDDAAAALRDRTNALAAPVAPSTYASVASAAARSGVSAAKVTVSRGRAFKIQTRSRITIGPKEDAVALLPDAAATKAALVKSVNPAELKMRVDRVRYGLGATVVVEGEGLDADALGACPKLAAAGLEVKPNSLLNPRLIVHGVPVELGARRLCEPTLRRQLLSRQRISIQWLVCRVEDHVSVTECFKCSGFGHIAAKCPKSACCSHCAGGHLTEERESRENLKCINCTEAGHASHAHSARDRAKCVILRRRIERKISTINYGQ
ncbi:hypothetical protein TKK_0011767 [Trichogramma kaykai]